MELGEPLWRAGHRRGIAVVSTSVVHVPRRINLEHREATNWRWMLSSRRWGDRVLSTSAAFLVIFAVCFVALGVGAYYFAQLTLVAT
jgi:hypothetical protein